MRCRRLLNSAASRPSGRKGCPGGSRGAAAGDAATMFRYDDPSGDSLTIIEQVGSVVATIRGGIEAIIDVSDAGAMARWVEGGVPFTMIAPIGLGMSWWLWLSRSDLSDQAFTPVSCPVSMAYSQPLSSGGSIPRWSAPWPPAIDARSRD